MRRRYKDFDALNVALGDTYGKHMVPPNFPGKQLVKNESAEFVEQRRHELRRWLAAVTEDRYLSLSPEVCAFLECEAATQLAARTAALSAGAALLAAELGAAEHQAARAESARPRCSSRCSAHRAAAARRGARAAAAAARGATLRAPSPSAPTGRSPTPSAASAAARRRSTPAADAAAAAPDAVAAGEAPAVCGKPRDDAKTPATVAPPAARRARQACRRLRSRSWATSTPLRSTRRCAAAARRPRRRSTAARRRAAAQAAAGGERVVKAGALLKQGSLNNEFRERFCELVSLGDGGRSFLVYYEAAAPPASSSSPYEPYEAEAPKGAVKGYICLDGASAATLDHPTQQHCLLITLPARRLSFLTPGVSPGPLFTPTLRSPRCRRPTTR